jgi:hypothetical protein
MSSFEEGEVRPEVIHEMRVLADQEADVAELVDHLLNRLELNDRNGLLPVLSYFRAAFHLSLSDVLPLREWLGQKDRSEVDSILLPAMGRTKDRWQQKIFARTKDKKYYQVFAAQLESVDGTVVESVRSAMQVKKILRSHPDMSFRLDPHPRALVAGTRRGDERPIDCGIVCGLVRFDPNRNEEVVESGEYELQGTLPRNSAVTSTP